MIKPQVKKESWMMKEETKVRLPFFSVLPGQGAGLGFRAVPMGVGMGVTLGVGMAVGMAVERGSVHAAER